MQLMLIFFSKALVKHSINVTITHPTPNITITEKVFSMFHFSLSWRALHLPLLPDPQPCDTGYHGHSYSELRQRPRRGEPSDITECLDTRQRGSGTVPMMISITMPLSSSLINIIFRFKLSASMGWAGGRNKQNHRGTYSEIVVVWERQKVSKPRNNKRFK